MQVTHNTSFSARVFIRGTIAAHQRKKCYFQTASDTVYSVTIYVVRIGSSDVTSAGGNG
jgi:hypothetical protein